MEPSPEGGWKRGTEVLPSIISVYFLQSPNAIEQNNILFCQIQTVAGHQLGAYLSGAMALMVTFLLI